MTNWCLLTGRNGYLWIGTYDAGLDRYDPATGSVKHFRHDPKDATSINWGPVTAIAEDHSGTLWVGTYGEGAARFDPTTERFTRYCHDPSDPTSLSHNSVAAILEDSEGTIWIGTQDGLSALSVDRKCFTVFRHDPRNAASLSGNSITSLWCEPRGALWAGTSKSGLNRLEDKRQGRFKRFSTSTLHPRGVFCDSVTSIIQGAARYLWVGTKNGLHRIYPATGDVEHFVHDPHDENSIGTNYIRALDVDRTGSLWIACNQLGTAPQRQGINKLLRSDQFGYYRVERRGGGALPVVALRHDPATDITWIGTEGVRAFHRPSGRVVEYLNRPGDPTSLSDNLTNTVLLDTRGSVWIGTWNGGLNRLLPSRRGFARYVWQDRRGGLGGNVISMCEDITPRGSGGRDELRFWIGTFSEGVLQFSPNGGVLARYCHVSGDLSSLGNDRALAVLVDRTGTLWVGTDGGGLNRLDRSAGRFTVFRHDPLDPSTLQSSRINALLEDTTSTQPGETILWVGTATGLDRFHAGTGRAMHIELQDSARAMGIAAVTYQGEDLWVCTTQDGLFRYSPRTHAKRWYGEENGIPSNTFTSAASRTQTGELLLGLYEGFLAFHPLDLHDNPHAPPVALTSLTIFDSLVQDPRPLWSIPRIDLKYDQNFFSFHFAALDFTNPRRNTFAFMLDGFDKEWHRPGTRNFAGYTKVDPGEYTFRVKAANSDGVWNESGVSIKLRVAPPYWRTWWFRALIGIAVLALLAGAYRYRVAQLLEVERVRLRIASDLHDDIGSSLSGLALLTDSLRSHASIAEPDRQRLAEATRTARHTADALRDIVWLVNPGHDSVDDIFLRMKDAAGMILTGIEYSIATSGESLGRTMPIEFRHNLILMYKEILNNIAKHAQAHHVTIAIREENGTFSLRIADDGIGFDPASASRGNGLHNLRQRAGRMGGSLTFESERGQGTVVAFHAPVA